MSERRGVRLEAKSNSVALVGRREWSGRLRLASWLVIAALSLGGCSAGRSSATGSGTVPAGDGAGLSMAQVGRLVMAKRGLDSLLQAYPETQLPRLSLPFEPSPLERALANNPRFVGVLQQTGISPRVYARDLGRLATAIFAVAAAARQSQSGPYLMMRVMPVVNTPTTSWSEWLAIPRLDANFVRQYQAELALAGMSVRGLRLTSQLPTTETRAFPSQDGDYLDSTDVPEAKGRPLRVLFLSDGGGGSARYRHNEAYRLFRLIAASGLNRRVVVGQVTRPRMLIDLWAEDMMRPEPVIQHLPWDYVVLQEYEYVYALDASGQGNDSEIKRNTDKMLAALPVYDRAIKAAGARMVYTIFGRDDEQKTTVAALTAAARSVNAIPAQMSAAWQRAGMRTRRPPYRRDDTGRGTGHLDPDGHYLQALVYYRAITGRSPIGLPAPPIEVGLGTRRMLSPEDVLLLQRAAAGVK